MKLHLVNVVIAAMAISAMSGFTGKLKAQTAAPTPKNGQTLIVSIKGSELFQAYCSSCHGRDAKGDGPMATSLKIRPADLTQIANRNNGNFELARIRRVISGEELIKGSHGSREMPVWGPIFSQVASDVDLGRVRIDNLARYLRDVQVKKNSK